MSDNTPKVTALGNIKHNGRNYVRGDLVPVNGSHLEQLLAIGAVSIEKGEADVKEETLPDND